MADFYFIHLILSILMMEEEKRFNYRFSLISSTLWCLRERECVSDASNWQLTFPFSALSLPAAAATFSFLSFNAAVVCNFLWLTVDITIVNPYFLFCASVQFKCYKGASNYKTIQQVNFLFHLQNDERSSCNSRGRFTFRVPSGPLSLFLDKFSLPNDN